MAGNARCAGLRPHHRDADWAISSYGRTDGTSTPVLDRLAELGDPLAPLIGAQQELPWL